MVCVYQNIGKIIKTFKTQVMVLDDVNPWDGIVAAMVFSMRATLHSSTKHTPAQIVVLL